MNVNTVFRLINKKVQCYQQYGLTSYLASCSASLLTRKTYLATTVKSDIYVTDIKESIIQVGETPTRKRSFPWCPVWGTQTYFVSSEPKVSKKGQQKREIF